MEFPGCFELDDIRTVYGLGAGQLRQAKEIFQNLIIQLCLPSQNFYTRPVNRDFFQEISQNLPQVLPR